MQYVVGERKSANDPLGLMVRGIDKQVVGEEAARIRGLCPLEPYKGKGIRYRKRRSAARPARPARPSRARRDPRPTGSALDNLSRSMGDTISIASVRIDQRQGEPRVICVSGATTACASASAAHPSGRG